VIDKINEPIDHLTNESRFRGEILFSRKHQSHPRGGDRERSLQARQAADALFTKSQVRTPSVSEVSSTAMAARKPRVLPTIAPLAPLLPGKSETAAFSRPAGEIPRSQLARIRAWLEYGMTTAQVAQVYGVAVAEIELILRYR
jgi:hypothetical protein